MGYIGSDPVRNDSVSTAQLADDAVTSPKIADDIVFTNITGSKVSASLGEFTSATIEGGTITGITDLAVADGGTGASTLTDGGILLGSGTSAVTAMAVLADGEFVVGDGTTDPVAESGDTARISLGVGSTSTWQITGLNIGAASDTTLTRPSAGDLQIESNIIYRAGGTDVAVADGGTGASTLNDLITLTTHTTGNYVGTLTGGTGITSTGATSGEGIAHSISVDASQTQITGLSTVTTGVWNSTFGSTANALISGSFGNQRVGTTDSPTFTDVTATGTITAQEFHTEFVSASINYTSGSNKFGDTIDDIHSFTGSINQSGSFNLNDGNLVVTDNIDLEGDIDVNGTSNLDIVDIDGAVNMAADLTMGANILMADDTSIGIADDAERIEFDGSGDISVLGANLGIGTASPANKIEVQTDIDAVSGSRFSVNSGNDSYTKLLIHSDNSDGTTIFADSSANGRIITVSGDTHHETGQQKFGASSIQFDGTGDFLTLPASSNRDWQLGNTFTIDCWVNFNATNQDQCIFHHRYDASYDFLFYKKASNAWAINHNSVDQLTWNWSPSSGTWYHIAIVNESGTVSVYVDGTALSLTSGSNGSYTAPLVPLTTTVKIGQRMHGDMDMNGYLDEYRVSKGIARWSSNFKAPTRPYGHALTVDGPRGKLYSVTDSMETHGSGSIFSVNTTGGIPVIEAKDDYTTHFRGNLSLREPFTTPTTTGNETKIYTKKDTKPDSLTTLLIHSDSTDGSTDFVDSSVGHLFTTAGDTQHSTVKSKFGNSSVYFDGSDQLRFGNENHPDFNFGTGVFTIDLWINPTNATAAQQPFALKHLNDGNNWVWGIDGNDIEMYHRTGYGGYTQVFTGTHGMSSDRWYHVALVRESATSWKTYVNGVQKATSSTNVNLDVGVAQFRMGWTDNEWGASGNGYYTGYIDEYRVSKGIARWTAAFTPPASPYETDANTVLLIHSDTINGDTLFIDSSETVSTRKTITDNGGVHHENTQKKFGSTGIQFDGSNDWLQIPDHADMNFGSGDFTIDFWIRWDDLSGTEYPMGGGTAVSNGDRTWAWGWDSSNIRFIRTSSSSSWTAEVRYSHTPVISTWYHYAFVYGNSKVNFYVDGVAKGELSTSGNGSGAETIRDSSGEGIGIGNHAGYFFPGYMDEIRFSKGIARWTGNFDPPKRRYPLNEDKLLIKSDDGIEKTVIAVEPHGVGRHGQILKSTGEGGVQWQNTSVEMFYQAQSTYAVSLDLRNVQAVGNWIMAQNMEVGNNFVVGKAPEGFIRVTAIKIGVFNVQGQTASQGVRMKWEIASDGQGYQTHTQGITTVRTFPGTDTAANTIFEADAFNLTGTNDFEDLISSGDYFGMAFDDLVSHNSAVLGVGITWEF